MEKNISVLSGESLVSLITDSTGAPADENCTARQVERLEPRYMNTFNSYMLGRFVQRWINPILVPHPAYFSQTLIKAGFPVSAKILSDSDKSKEYKAGVKAWNAQVLPKGRAALIQQRRMALERSVMSLGILQGGYRASQAVWLNLAAEVLQHALPSEIKASVDRVSGLTHTHGDSISLIVISGTDSVSLEEVMASILDSGCTRRLKHQGVFSSEDEAVFHALSIALDFLRCHNGTVPDRSRSLSSGSLEPVHLLFDPPATEAEASSKPVEIEKPAESSSDSLSHVMAYEPVIGGYTGIHAIAYVANTAEDFSKAYGRWRRNLDPEPQCSVYDFPVLVPNIDSDDKGQPPTQYQNLSFLEGERNIKHKAKVRVPETGYPFKPAQMRKLINSILAPKSVGTYYALIGLLSEPSALASVSPDAQHVFRHGGLTIAANVDLRKLLPAIGFTDSRHVNEKSIHDFLDLLVSWNQVYIHIKNPTLWSKKKGQYVSYDCEAPLLPFFTYDDSLRTPGQKSIKAGPAVAYIDMGPLARFSSNFRIPCPKGVELGWAPRPLLYWLWAKAFEKSDFGKKEPSGPVVFTLAQGATFIGLHSRVENLSKYRKQVEKTLIKVLEELHEANLLPDFELEDGFFKVHFTAAFLGDIFLSDDSQDPPPQLPASN